MKPSVLLPWVTSLFVFLSNSQPAWGGPCCTLSGGAVPVTVILTVGTDAPAGTTAGGATLSVNGAGGTPGPSSVRTVKMVPGKPTTFDLSVTDIDLTGPCFGTSANVSFQACGNAVFLIQRRGDTFWRYYDDAAIHGYNNSDWDVRQCGGQQIPILANVWKKKVYTEVNFTCSDGQWQPFDPTLLPEGMIAAVGPGGFGEDYADYILWDGTLIPCEPPTDAQLEATPGDYMFTTVDTGQTTSEFQQPLNYNDSATVILWYKDGNQLFDPGQGSCSGPGTPSGQISGGNEPEPDISGQPAALPVTQSIGLGRDSNGQATGALEYYADLAESDPLTKDHFFVSDPTSSLVTTFAGFGSNLPEGVFERIASAEAVVDLSSTSTGNTHRQNVTVTVSNASTSAVIATFIIEKVSDAQYGPGLKMTTTPAGGTTTVTQYFGTSTANGTAWKTLFPNGEVETGTLSITTGATNTSPATAARAVTRVQGTVTTAALYSDYSRLANDTSGTWYLMEETAGSGTASLTSSYVYDSINPLSMGSLLCVTRSDGTWEKYQYDGTTGALVRHFSPWLDGPASPADATIDNARVQTYLYYPNGSDTSYQSGIAPDSETWELDSVAGEVVSRTWNGTWNNTVDPSSDATAWEDNQRTATDYTYYYLNLYGVLGSGRDPQSPFPVGAYAGGGTVMPTSYLVPQTDTSIWNGSFSMNMQQTFTADYSGWNGTINLTDLSTGDFSRSIDSTGKITLYQYERGSWDETSGTFTPNGTGSDGALAMRQTQRTFCSDPGTLVIYGELPTRTVTTMDYQGLSRIVESQIMDSVGNVSTLYQTRNDYDPTTRQLVNSQIGNQLTYHATIESPTSLVEADEQGVQTRTQTNDTNGKVTTSKLSLGGQPVLTTVRSTSGLTTTTIRDGGAPTITLSSSTTVDLLGRTVSSTDENGITTTWSYSQSSSGGQVITESRPGFADKVTTYYLDGQIKSITGGDSVAEFHTFAVNGDGTLTETVSHGSPGANWVSTTTDGLGRVVREDHPSPAPGNPLITTIHSYNTKGQEVATSTTALPTVLRVYDAAGSLCAQGQDIDGNGTLDVDGVDRFQATLTGFNRASDGKWWNYSVTAWITATGPAHTDTRSTLGSPLDSFTLTTYPDGHWIQIKQTIHPETRTTTVTETGNRASQPAMQTAINGLLVTSTSHEVTAPATYTYDGLERQVSVVDPDGMKHLTLYATGKTWVQSEQLVPIGGTSALTQATYSYNAAGQLASQADGAGNTTAYTYDTAGRIQTTSGSGTYPVWYEYDAASGKIARLHTFRSAPPADLTTAQGDVTTWAYDQATGALLSKADAAGASVTYTYDLAGRVHSRTWARGISTTYSYDDPGGLLSAISYSDSTPGVTYTYFRDNTVHTCTDAAGLHTYSPATAPGTMATETISGDTGWLSGLTFMNQMDAMGRRTAWAAQSTVGGANAIDLSVGFGYDGARGLMNTVTSPATNPTTTWTYGYAAANTHITTLSAQTGSSLVTNVRQYDAVGNVASLRWQRGGADATWSGNGIIGWQYGYSSTLIHQRTSTLPYAPPGSTPTATDPPGWSYSGYNSRGELTQAQRLLPNGSTAAGQTWNYAYDNIGNRTSMSRASGVSSPASYDTTYQSNALNQYSSIGNISQALEVRGQTAAPTQVPRVSINGQPATGRPPMSGGEYGGYDYWLTYNATGPNAALDNTSGPAWPMVSVTAQSTLTPTSNTVSTTTQGYVYMPPATETLTYDLDGNLLSDGRWTYTWDGENRLVQMEEKLRPQAISSSPVRRQLQVAYDARGRRIAKQVRKDDAAGGWAQQYARVFLYDGWNLMAELNGAVPAASGMVRRYVWGLDVTGTLRGAGGVGGLLAVQYYNLSETNSQLTLVGSEALGNVMSLTNAATGQIIAKFDYDVFGNQITDWSALSIATNGLCPFGFSTKFLDPETKSIYYGYRYYNSLTSRWTSKDPIGMRGGVNVFQFCFNNSVGVFDYLGRDGVRVAPEGRRGTPSRPAAPSLPERGAPMPEEPDPWEGAGEGPLDAPVDIFGILPDNFDPTYPIGYQEPDPETDPRRKPKSRKPAVKILPLKPDKGCSCKRTPPRGGNQDHDKYATWLNDGHNDNFEVTTPKGQKASYDAAVPWGGGEIVVIEAKTGCGWMNGNNVNPAWILTRQHQFENQSQVATACGFNYLIAVDNDGGAKGLRLRLPAFSNNIRYIQPQYR